MGLHSIIFIVFALRVQGQVSPTTTAESCPDGTYSVSNNWCACDNDPTNQQYLPVDSSHCVSPTTMANICPDGTYRVGNGSCACDNDPTNKQYLPMDSSHCGSYMTTETPTALDCDQCVQEFIFNDLCRCYYEDCHSDVMPESCGGSDVCGADLWNACQDYDESSMEDAIPDPVPVPDNTPAPTTEVKFTMKLGGMTENELDANTQKVKQSLSESTGVAVKYIAVGKVSRRRRKLRRMLNEIDVQVTIQTHDKDAVEAFVTSDDFEDDLEIRISDKTGLQVTVNDLSTPTASNIETTTTTTTTTAEQSTESTATPSSDSDDSANLTWLWVILALLGVGAIAAVVYFALQQSEEEDKDDMMTGGGALDGDMEMIKNESTPQNKANGEVDIAETIGVEDSVESETLSYDIIGQTA